MLPASVQVCPVEIPGRGRRSREEAIDSVSKLADVLVESLPLQVRIIMTDNFHWQEHQQHVSAVLKSIASH